MKTKEILPEDVIETALQYGMESAGRRFGLNYEETKAIVKPFTDEIDEGVGITNMCPCEVDRSNGIPTMCFMCTGNQSRRG